MNIYSNYLKYNSILVKYYRTNLKLVITKPHVILESDII